MRQASLCAHLCLLVLYNPNLAKSTLADGPKQIEVIQVDRPIKVDDLLGEV